MTHHTHIARPAAWIALFLLGFCRPAFGQEPPPSPWPMLHGSAARAAMAASRGPRRPSLVGRLPFFQHSNVLFRSPIATSEGGLIASVFGSTPNRGAEARLLQVRPDGAIQLLARAGMFGDPAVTPAGDLFVLALVDGEYQLLILPANPDEEIDPILLPPARPAFNSPAIGADGSTFIAINGLVVGLTAKGKVRWSWAHPQYGDPTGTAPTVVGSPAIGPDGTMYVVFLDGVYAFESRSGGLVWRSNYQFVDTDRPLDGPVVAPDGTLYVITQTPPTPEEEIGETFLYSLRPNGGLNWRWPAGRGTVRHPAVDASGSVYLPITDLLLDEERVVGRLHVLNPDSTPRRPPLERSAEQGMIEAVVLDSTGSLFAIAPLATETLLLGFRPDGADLFPPAPVPGRLSGPLGAPLPGMLTAMTQRAVALLADGPILELTMAVDAATASPTATLTYTVRIRNIGVLPATNLLLRAGIPSIARYVPGSTAINGRPVADLGDTSPVVGGVNAGLLAPNAEAVLTFRATLQRPAPGASILNAATARSDQLGAHTSNTVTTRIN